MRSGDYDRHIENNDDEDVLKLRGWRSGDYYGDYCDYDRHYGGYRNQDDQDAQLAEVKIR